MRWMNKWAQKHDRILKFTRHGTHHFDFGDIDRLRFQANAISPGDLGGSGLLFDWESSAGFADHKTPRLRWKSEASMISFST
jgi:hypothetical protein